MKIKKIIFLYFLFVAKAVAQSSDVSIFNDSHEALIQLFEHIDNLEVDKNNEFFDALILCYEQLKQGGDQTRCLKDLLEACPLLIAYAEQYTNQRSVSGDIGPIIVLLNALKLQILELNLDQANCCETLQLDFEITFSMLLELTQSFSMVDSALPLLVETVASLTNSITSFTGISSSITTLQETVDLCCESINGSLEEINTILVNGNNSISTDFQQTWTILDATLQVIDNCCDATADNFNGTWTLIGANFNQVISLLSTATMENSCQQMLLATPTIITASGSYCLASNITGTIIINAHDVVLDLNKHTIFNGQIIINDKNNSIIKNGILDNNSTGSCALSIINCSNVIVDNLMIINPNDGIQCGQATNIIIRNSSISGALKNGIDIINTVTALRIQDLEIIKTTSNALYCNANMQDVELRHVRIKFSNGIRAEAGFLATNIKCIDVFVEGTPLPLFPIIFLGTSNNLFFDNVHIADASQGMRFSFLSQSLFQNCVIKSITTPIASVGSGFRLDGGNNNQFHHCKVFNMLATGNTVLDAFKLGNSNTCIVKECFVEGINGVNGMVTGFNCTGAQRITIEDCMVQNIITSSLAIGYYLQASTNVVMNNCIANNLSSHGYFSSGGSNTIINNCIANNCLLDGFRSIAATNMAYEYCRSNNNGGSGFYVNNAICGNCVSNRNSGFGFYGNSNSIAYDCFAGLNTGADYSAITSSVQALGATGPRVGHSISV